MALKNSEEEIGFLGDDLSVSVSDSAGLSGSISQPPQHFQTEASASQRAGNAGAAENVVDLFKSSTHPVAAVFHVAFKIAALFLFVFGKWISDSFVEIFVLCIVCLAFDFWTVKNVTGRLMVRLRWWNEVKEDGSSDWRFESAEDPDAVSGVDYRIFWYSMYLNVVLWVFFGFLNILSFDWLLLVIVAIALNVSNIYGYWQCSKFARQRLEGAVQGMVQQHAMSAFASSLTSSFGKAFSSSGNTAAV